MCGSRGHFWIPPRRMPPVRHDIETQTSDTEYKAEVSSIMQDVLSDYNSRDVEAIHNHLDLLKKALSKEIDDVIEIVFGGSVAKHSYVDGLSDVDVLVNVAGTELAFKSPEELLKYFSELIQDRLPDTKVKVGSMALTVAYSDGCEIQLLPTIKTPDGIRVSNRYGTGWSNIVRPQDFTKKLSEVNNASGRLVVPVIKLFKGAQSSFPEDAQLSGYHVESLAVNAFRNYTGNLNTKEMFRHLCGYITDQVKFPVADSTGQSIHVDDSFGPANSTQRQLSSTYVQRLANRLDAADSNRDPEVWKEVFGA